MSYCVNPTCQKPENHIDNRLCESCGSKLRLSDRYYAIKPIGQGSFGRTFLAVDKYKPSKPPCVIKQFLPQTPGTNNHQKAAELFDKEALRLDELGKHPQIPELLAYFTEDDQQYLVQEFIDGENLEAELAQKGRFTETQIWELLNDFLPVLQFIHSKQIIHRDIKPANIIRRKTNTLPLYSGLTNIDQLVLVDFGAAKFVTEINLEKHGTVIGSLGYVSPEQAVGKAIFGSDIYSLGVTCIHLLTQIDPCNLYDTSEGDWVWWKYLDDNIISDDLERILDKMLERGTKWRYHSAEEVLTDIKRVEKKRLASLHAIAQSIPITSSYYPTTTFSAQSTSLHTKYNSLTKPPVYTQNWKSVRTLTGHSDVVRCLVFSPDNRIVASGSWDNTIKLWQPNTGRVINTLAEHLGWVDSVAFSPDGEVLASGSSDNTIKLWIVRTGKLISTLIGHSYLVGSLAFSPDGEVLASGSSDNTIKLWHPITGKLVHTIKGHGSWVNSIKFSPDSEVLASASSDNTIKLWQVQTGKLLFTFKGHSNSVKSIAYSPDGEILASGSDDNTIKLWETQTGKLIRTLTGHSGWVDAVAFSADGETLITGSWDNTIKIWQTTSGRLIHTLNNHLYPISCIANSPDGEFLASGSWDNTIKIWQRESI